MDDGGGASRAGATAEEHADKKQLSVQFKAQHALVVAFFLLILYEPLQTSTFHCSADNLQASFTLSPSTSSAAASSSPASSSKTAPSAPFLPSICKMDTYPGRTSEDVGIPRALIKR